MPRDASGVYSLPAGNPVITNTVISSVWANTTLSDIAAQLNNVFTRDGLLGPTGPFKIVDGTVAAPGLAWNSEPGMGWMRLAAGQIGFAQGGVRIWGRSVVGNDVFEALCAKAAGAQAIHSVQNAPPGSPNYNSMDFMVDAAGNFVIRGNKVGTATDKSLGLNFAAGVAASNVFAAPVIRWGPSGLGSGTYLGFTGNDPILVWSPGWSFQWESATGRLNYYRNNGSSPTTAFNANGDFIAGRDIYCGSAGGLALINSTAGVATLRFTPDQWKLEWQNGYLQYYNTSGTSVFLMNGNDGTAGCYGSFYAGRGGAGGYLATTGSSGIPGLDVSGYNTAGSVLYKVLCQGNPNWGNVNLQAVHAQGVWAGARLFGGSSPGDAVDFHLSTGTGWGRVVAGGFDPASDERAKENIEPLVFLPNEFMQIRPIMWHWPQQTHSPDDPPIYDLHDKEWGFSAQNFAAIGLRSLVHGDVTAVDGDGKPIIAAIDIPGVLALTVLAVQNLIARVEALEAVP